MDNANLYKDESLHQIGSSIWSNTTLEDVFARSSRDEDDEAALTWAALEKLPTYNRIRKGFLSGVDGGELKEVNIKDLGYQERKSLLERLIKVAEEDLEKFLLKVKNRIERYLCFICFSWFWNLEFQTIVTLFAVCLICISSLQFVI